MSISMLFTTASLAALALLLLLTMAEVALSELRRLDAVLSRRGIRLAERTLFAILAGAAIFTAYPTSAEKRGQGESPGDGQPSREQPDRSGTGGVEIGNPDAPSDAPTFPAWTNALDSLAFTGIAVEGTSVWMRVSWPTNEPTAADGVDFFYAHDCGTNIWSFAGGVPVPSATNETVVAVNVATNAADMADRMFFRAGFNSDADGDGLSDPYELFVTLTSPFAEDTDGDGLPDGWEHENGLDPCFWSDAYDDPDGDGLPNLYEYHNGTQPQTADAESAGRIVAGGSGTNAVATLAEALAASRPYSVIEVADGIHEGSGWAGWSIILPEHPVLITSSDGGRSRRAIIRHTEQYAAMYLTATQATHTVVQGLCFELAATSGMQMAFWCGGALPWTGPPAGGMFRDIYVRMPNPGVAYEGWRFRNYESNEVVVASCTVNAHGATNARGVYAVDSPPMSVENCTFVNFPPNDGGLGYGIQYESSPQNWSGAPDPIPLEIVNCLFDASFTNAYALAPREEGVTYDVSMLNCIVPSPLVYEADSTEGLVVTNAGTSFSGHIPAGSPARGAGVESLYAPLDIDGEDRPAIPDIGSDQYVSDAGTSDTDGDGIPDADENWVYGTDPFFADSDWDGSPDGDEIANGTDPLDRLSHLATLTLTVTNTDVSATLTNYFGFSWTESGWDVTNASAATQWGQTSLVVDDTGGVYGKAFADLNRNGTYDENADVMRAVRLASVYAVVNATIVLGDIDKDGVSDADERSDGTDPYDAGNFLLNAVVRITDSDAGNGITNYVAHFTSQALAVPVASNAFVSATQNHLIADAATEGKIYVRGFRDINGNGTYDEGVDGVFSVDLSKGSQGATVGLAIGDSDGDGIRDSVEMSEGTSPMNRLNYCFNCEVEIDEIFSTTNSLVARAMFGADCLYGPEIQTNSTLALDLGHLVATNGENVAVCFWDDIDGDSVLDNGEPSVSVAVNAQSHDVQYRCSLPYGGFDANRDGLPDWWQACCGLEDGAYEDTDGDGLINLHELWAGCDPLSPDGSNTVLSVMSRSVDDRISGRTANDLSKCVYMNYADPDMATKFSANTNCWAHGIDFSCASPWNAMDGNKRAGTAISTRHVLFAKHFALANGEIYFHMSNGSVHTNSIVATRMHPDNSVDICVGLLALNLPSAVRPAKILPQNYNAYIKGGHALPTMSFDQDEHALVHEVENISSTVFGMAPSGKRLEFSEQIISGDSGNPRFFVIDDDVILLNTFHYGGNGSGPSVRHYADAIQLLMNQLSAAANLEVSDYVLEEYDFGGYDQCEN